MLSKVMIITLALNVVLLPKMAPASDDAARAGLQPGAQAAFLAFSIAGQVNQMCNLVRGNIRMRGGRNVSNLYRKVDSSGKNVGSLIPPYARVADIQRIIYSEENEFKQFLERQSKDSLCANSTLVEPSRRLLSAFMERDFDVDNWLKRGSYIDEFPNKYLLMAGTTKLPVEMLVSDIKSQEYILMHKPDRFEIEGVRVVPFPDLAPILRFYVKGVQEETLSEGLNVDSDLIGNHYKLYTKERGNSWNGPDQFASEAVREHFEINVMPRITKAIQRLKFPINLEFIRKFGAFEYNEEAQVLTLTKIRPVNISKRIRRQFSFEGDIEINENGIINSPDEVALPPQHAREVAERLRAYDSWALVRTSLKIHAVEDRDASEPALIMSLVGQDLTSWEEDPNLIIESMQDMLASP